MKKTGWRDLVATPYRFVRDRNENLCRMVNDKLNEPLYVRQSRITDGCLKDIVYLLVKKCGFSCGFTIEDDDPRPTKQIREETSQLKKQNARSRYRKFCDSK